MSDHLWRKERTRLYLLSYNELLYLLQKYPKPNPYILTKDAWTQTSPPSCSNKSDSEISRTLVMTPSAPSTKPSPASTRSPTVVMSPSPHTKQKKQCNPYILNTPPTKPIPFFDNKSMKTMRASAIKVSDSLLNSLIKNNTNNNTANDSENEIQNDSENEIQNNRKRSYQQLMENNNTNHNEINELNQSFSQCNVNHNNNRPLKRRKIARKYTKNSNKNKKIPPNVSPQDMNKNMLLQYHNLNNSVVETSEITHTKKAIKPKLVRSNNNHFSVTSNFRNKNMNHIKKQLQFSDSYESIESSSPPTYNQFKTKKTDHDIKNKKTVQKKKKQRNNKRKMSAIPRIRTCTVDTQPQHIIRTPQKNINKNKNKSKPANRTSTTQTKQRKRACLALKEASIHHPNVTRNEIDDSNFFGLLPELDEEDIKQCDKLATSMISNEYEEKQMSNNEIIRFENNIQNISPIHSNEKEWKLRNDSIPDNSSTHSEKFVTRKQHKYTPLWKASMNLPENEKCFDMNKLRADNDRHPLNKYDEKYLNENEISPQTKMAQDSLRSNTSNTSYTSYNDKDMNTHSQIVEKYQKNVTCFGANDDNNMYEESGGSKVSLFDNTDFSQEKMKINSLLDQSNNDMQCDNQNHKNNGVHKYSVFEFPKD